MYSKMVRLLVVCAINKADRLVVHRVFIISGRRSRRHEKLLRECFEIHISRREGSEDVQRLVVGREQIVFALRKERKNSSRVTGAGFAICQF